MKNKYIKQGFVCMLSAFSLIALLGVVNIKSNHRVNADETTAYNNDKDKKKIDGSLKNKKLIFTRKHKEVKCGKQRVFRVNLNGAKWKVSDKKIAKIKKIDDRRIVLTGKRYGKVTLTVRVKGKKISTKVKIMPKAIVGIDAGHQKNANYELEPIGPGSSQKKIKVAGGTRGISTGKSEGTLNLEIALKLKEKLIDKGYKVVMVREKAEVNISNSERAKKLNKKCDISIRIHADGSDNSTINGVSLLYPPASNPYIGNLSGKSYKLASCILEKYCEKTGIKNNGLKGRNDLTGFNFSTIPVALIEMGYMTNYSEDEFMSSSSGQKKMVDGIALGVEKYYGYEK